MPIVIVLSVTLGSVAQPRVEKAIALIAASRFRTCIITLPDCCSRILAVGQRCGNSSFPDFGHGWAGCQQSCFWCVVIKLKSKRPYRLLRLWMQPQLLRSTGKNGKNNLPRRCRFSVATGQRKAVLKPRNQSSKNSLTLSIHDLARGLCLAPLSRLDSSSSRSNSFWRSVRLTGVSTTT